MKLLKREITVIIETLIRIFNQKIAHYSVVNKPDNENVRYSLTLGFVEALQNINIAELQQLSILKRRLQEIANSTSIFDDVPDKALNETQLKHAENERAMFRYMIDNNVTLWLEQYRNKNRKSE